jgi:hypothetical protein
LYEPRRKLPEKPITVIIAALLRPSMRLRFNR